MASFYNQATLSYSGRTVSSNIASGEIVGVLSLTKTPVVDEYAAGSDISYVLNIINSGTVPYTELSLSDDLGAYQFEDKSLVPLSYADGSMKYFINGVLQPEPSVEAGPPLTVSGISVPAGGAATLIYTVSVNEFAPLDAGGSVTNTATLSGGIADITASATVTAASGPVLEINKSVSPSPVAENGQLTYTFMIQNCGNAAADVGADVVLHDVFDPLLSDLSVTYNGEVWTETDHYSYGADTGDFSTVEGTVTVPAAEFTRDPDSGAWTCVPGQTIITVTGTL